MTTPIDELTGRELDAAVAEEVMGWKPYKDGMLGDYVRFFPPEGDPVGEAAGEGFVPVNVGPGWDWSPSTSIEAAWQVVEKVGRVRIEQFSDGWYVAFGESGVERDMTLETVVADAAPEAIAKAALAAVRSQRGVQEG